MAIKRLAREASFPNIGRLRKGGEKEVKTITKNGQTKEIETYGKDLTYFRFDTDDERAAKMFHAVYGEQPATINVYLPHQTAEQNFTCWQEAYVAGGLTHRCDGETCVIWLDNGKYRTDPKPCPGGCKEVGRLMVIIPELQRFAYVTAETHSIHDIIRLQENLQAVEFLRGDLRGIPFILKRTPVEISTPTPDGKRARREKWLLSIEVDPAWAALQLESMHRAALTVNGVTDESRMLTTSYVEEDDDVEDGEVVTVDTTSMDALGKELYGAKWVEVRQHNIDRVSGGAPLTQEHIDKLISGMRTLKTKRTAPPPKKPDVPAIVSAWLEARQPIEEAQRWAVDNELCKATPHAQNSIAKIIADQFNGDDSDTAAILTAFYRHQLDKKNQAVEAVAVEAEPVAAF